MKILSTLLLTAFTLLLAAAQSATNTPGPPDIAILKFSWSKVHPLQNNNIGDPSLETYDQVRDRVANERRMADARNSNNKSEAARIERVEQMREDAKSKAQQQKTPLPREAYNYKVTLQNNGAKTIKSIDWDYIFFDPLTKNEVAHHQFTSDEKIGPGKTKEFGVLYPSPPIRTISASALSNKKELPFKEQVILVRITYSDGSIWQHP
jgi:hypothetical protein